jgi:hypothetical protein
MQFVRTVPCWYLTDEGCAASNWKYLHNHVEAFGGLDELANLPLSI